MTFKELLNSAYNHTNFENAAEARELAEWLIRQLEEYHLVTMAHEKKLEELMDTNEYAFYTRKLVNELFKHNIQAMPDGSFKEFCKEHFSETTTGGKDNDTSIS